LDIGWDDVAHSKSERNRPVPALPPV
jgi:hypothetical protein